jgi:hypothetical protein
MDYSFLSGHKEQHNGASYVFPGNPRTYRMSERLNLVLNRFYRAYADAFPNALSPRICVIVEARNGASGYWTAAQPGTGPVFVIELDPTIDGNEEIFAHELSHPIIRLLGVPTGQSIGSIDSRIGDEFTSTSHHPFVFDFLDQVGYADEQRVGYTKSALEELDKLAHADFASPTYTAPPGQTWLALWYFNFYLLDRQNYETIYSIQKQKAPSVAHMMEVVRESWMVATRNKGVIKGNDASRCVRSFQSNLRNRLDLAERVSLQSFTDWRAWLFQQT